MGRPYGRPAGRRGRLAAPDRRSAAGRDVLPRAATPSTRRSRSTRCSPSSIRTCAASAATCSSSTHAPTGDGPLPQRHRPGAAPRRRAAAFAERGLDAVPARGAALGLPCPGTVAAWEAAAARFGTRALGDLLAPAIDGRARDGVEIGDRLAGWIGGRARRPRRRPDSRAPVPRRGRRAARARRRRSASRSWATSCAASPAPARATSTTASSATALARAVGEAGGLLRAADLRAYRPAGSRRSGSGTRASTSSPRPRTARASRRC